MPPASPQKKRQRKQEKEKGKARAPVQGGGQAGPSHVATTSGSEGIEEAEEWSWLSITDPSPSRQPPVFTKDGRCVLHRSRLLLYSYVLHLQLLFLNCWIISQSLLCRNWRCRLYALFWYTWQSYRCDHLCNPEPAQRISAHHWLSRWPHKSLGLSGCRSPSDYLYRTAYTFCRRTRAVQGRDLRFSRETEEK